MKVKVKGDEESVDNQDHQLHPHPHHQPIAFQSSSVMYSTIDLLLEIQMRFLVVLVSKELDRNRLPVISNQ